MSNPVSSPGNWEQLSLYLTDLDSKLAAAQQQSAAAQQEAAAARQQVIAHQPHAAATGRPFKPTNPENFDGTSKNLSVGDWLFQCRCFFEAVGLQDDNPERTRFAAALLRGAASKWWKQATEAADGGLAPKIHLWTDFVPAIKTRFETINSDQVARDRLADLRQFGSVMQYISIFQQVTNEITDISPSELLHRFLNGLKRTIRLDVEMYRLSHPDLTLAGAMNVAQRADAARSKYGFVRRDPQPSNPSMAIPNPDTPMSLGAIKNKRLTEEEKAELRRQGRCFYCREPGHIALRCPAKLGKE